MTILVDDRPAIFYVLVVSYYLSDNFNVAPVMQHNFPYLELESCMAAGRAVDARPPVEIDGIMTIRQCKHVALELDVTGVPLLASSIQ